MGMGPAPWLSIWPECRLDLETMHRRQRNCARFPRRFDSRGSTGMRPNAAMEGHSKVAVRLDGKVLLHRRISEGEEDNGFLETHIFVISQSH